MTPSFVSAPPSAQADASRTNEFGAKSKSSLKRTARFYSVHFNGLSLLARTYSSGRCLNEANRFSLSHWRSLSARKTHVNQDTAIATKINPATKTTPTTLMIR
jgi:hypothetical protein